MDFILTTIVSFLMFIFYSSAISNNTKTEPSNYNYEFYADRITNQFIKEMKKEHSLICIGSGGSMPHDVESILIVMQAYQQANIEQAAELLVKATEKLKDLVNKDEKIRPFLREYPFTTNRTIIRISFDDHNNRHYPDKKSIAFVFQVRDEIIYHYYDTEKEQYFELFKEPYETAKQRVLP
jgi:hypothetical protein